MAEDSTAKKEEELVDDPMMGEEGSQETGEAIEESATPFEESSLEEKVRAKTKDKLKNNKSLQSLDFILDIPLKVTVELGRTKMNIKEILQLSQGSVVELSKFAGEPLEILVNEKLIARGEVVVVNEKFGIRLTDIISPAERIEQLG